jgi:hypothetical protein
MHKKLKMTRFSALKQKISKEQKTSASGWKIQQYFWLKKNSLTEKFYF